MENKYNPDIHHRKSIRLKGYDYSQAGLYFVTICTQNRECLFGHIENGEMILNDAGKMISRIFIELPKYFNNIKIYEYIIMPNHFHAIIRIVGADSISAPNNGYGTDGPDFIPAQINECRADMTRADMESAPTGNKLKINGLPQIIQTFKRHTTIEYIKMVKQNILHPFDKSVWQRNYYEHIIRNEQDLQKIRDYIVFNPANWNIDENFCLLKGK